MHWFGADERGLALGVRQTAVPLGGLIAALVVPQLISEMLRSGSSSSPRLCCDGALVGVRVHPRQSAEHELEPATLARTLA